MEKTEDINSCFVVNAKGNVRFKMSHRLNAHEVLEYRRLREAVGEAGQQKRDFESKIVENIRPLLPKGFNLEETNFYSDWVKCECRADELAMQAPTPLPAAQKEDKPAPPKCPYEELRRSNDLKSILNSGVLSKAEKRKVLGLPEEAKE